MDGDITFTVKREPEMKDPIKRTVRVLVSTSLKLAVGPVALKKGEVRELVFLDQEEVDCCLGLKIFELVFGVNPHVLPTVPGTSVPATTPTATTVPVPAIGPAVPRRHRQPPSASIK